jgi:hypothetical protein
LRGLNDITPSCSEWFPAVVAHAVQLIRRVGVKMRLQVGTSLQVLACREVGRCKRRDLIFTGSI